jgi:hypothetical protein
VKLQCRECKTLNDDGSQTCVNPDCGASLRLAEQVEDPAHAPESAAGTPQAAGKACDCEYPDPDPGTGICLVRRARQAKIRRSSPIRRPTAQRCQ